MSVIVYGPQGCGKTKNSQAIARHFGMKRIVDGYASGQTLPNDALALTNQIGLPGALDYFEVMKKIKKP